MPDVAYTDTITVETLSSTIADDGLLYGVASFKVTAPLSAWIDHPASGFDFDEVPDSAQPLFYLPGPDPTLDNPQRWLVRGALESLAETGWEAYAAILVAGVSEPLARTALPLHFMKTRIVEATGLTLSRFVAAHSRYTPGQEITIIAGGYAAHLAETEPHKV